MQHTGPRLAGLGTRLLRLLPTVPPGDGEQRVGVGRPGALLADPDDAGPDVGGGADDGQVVELGPGADDAAAVRRPARPPGHFPEPDAEPERDAVAGEL